MDKMTSKTLNTRLADRLASLRRDQGWSLAQLAQISGLSRATLSRLENGEVSPTAEALGKLCAAHGLPLSRLMMQIEQAHAGYVPAADQPVWQDPATGLQRRQLSPPAPTLTAEVIECHLPAGQSILYDAPPRAGLEHHLLMRAGRLHLTVSGQRHDLQAGDSLRYHLNGPSHFETGAAEARYILVLA